MKRRGPARTEGRETRPTQPEPGSGTRVAAAKLASDAARATKRNAAIVLGNQRHAAALPALIRGLSDDEALVRAACAWALGQYDDPVARAALLAG